MKYNAYIRTASLTFNVFDLSQAQLSKLVQFYLNGETEITLSGRKYLLTGIQEIKIYTYEIEGKIEDAVNYYLKNLHFRGKRTGQQGYFLPPKTLSKMGKNITQQLIGDSEYGKNEPITMSPNCFVSTTRIKELIAIKSKDFDLSRLIRLCEEMNSNYSNKNFLSVGMIGRTIINHVPPIFGYKSFDEVASNYGGPKDHKSFKKNVKHLNDSLKNIADSFLHLTIRKKETLPTEVQIDFRQDMDVLLGEIVRILSTEGDV